MYAIGHNNLVYRLVATLFAATVFLLFNFITIFAAESKNHNKRMAIIVSNPVHGSDGNSKSHLKNSKLVSKALSQLGFEVTVANNVSKKSFAGVIKNFKDITTDYDTVLFYYFGTGLQLDAKNYLLPANLAASNNGTFKSKAISLDDLLSSLQGNKHQTLVFLDAYQPSSTILSKMQDSSEGLSRVQIESDTFIAFSSEPNSKAPNYIGGDSEFTLALVDNMQLPDLSISEMMENISETVKNNTKGKQTPWQQSNLRKQFYFKPENYETPKTSSSNSQKPLKPSLSISSFAIEDDKEEEKEPQKLASLKPRYNLIVPIIKTPAVEDVAPVTPGEPLENSASQRVPPSKTQELKENKSADLVASEQNTNTSSTEISASKSGSTGLDLKDSIIQAKEIKQPPVDKTIATELVETNQQKLQETNEALNINVAATSRSSTEESIKSTPRIVLDNEKSPVFAAVTNRTQQSPRSDKLASLENNTKTKLTQNINSITPLEQNDDKLSPSIQITSLGIPDDIDTSILGNQLGTITEPDQDNVELDQNDNTTASLDDAKDNSTNPVTSDNKVEEKLEADNFTPVPENIKFSIQSELARLGCYTYEIDGLWGKKSNGAVAKYLDAKKSTRKDLNPDIELYRTLVDEKELVCEPSRDNVKTPEEKSKKPAKKATTKSKPKSKAKTKKKTTSKPKKKAKTKPKKKPKKITKPKPKKKKSKIAKKSNSSKKKITKKVISRF